MSILLLPFRILRYIFGKPASFVSGDSFESYARKYLLTDRGFELIQKTHAYRSKRKDFVPSGQPDFKFRDRKTGRIFFVEAKFRKAFYKGQLTWCTEKQLRSYRSRMSEAPVFILLGIGGQPNRPLSVFLVPLKQVHFTSLYQSFVGKFRVPSHSLIRSRYIWNC